MDMLVSLKALDLKPAGFKEQILPTSKHASPNLQAPFRHERVEHASFTAECDAIHGPCVGLNGRLHGDGANACRVDAAAVEC